MNLLVVKNWKDGDGCSISELYKDWNKTGKDGHKITLYIYSTARAL